MIRFWNIFTKITAWPLQWLCFRTRIYYEDKNVQSRRIKGPAIVICNHTSVFDYAVLLFVFFSRTVRYQMAEVLFDKKPLGTLLRLLGGIKVDRNSHNYGYMTVCEDILSDGGVVGIFPEGRIPKDDETRPLEFRDGAAYLALYGNVPIIPVYTNGSYFQKRHASVIIGKPVNVNDLTDIDNDDLTDKEKIKIITGSLREKIILLGEELTKRDER